MSKLKLKRRTNECTMICVSCGKRASGDYLRTNFELGTSSCAFALPSGWYAARIRGGHGGTCCSVGCAQEFLDCNKRAVA